MQINRFSWVIVITFLVGCATPSSKEKGSGKPMVVATTMMLFDAVNNIGGDLIQSESIMGPGVDPHLYKATQGDLKKLIDADLIIYNGLYLEGKMGEILEKMQKQKTVVAAAESIPSSLLLSDLVYENAHDPHVWFNISNWKIVAEAVAKALKDVDPKHAPEYDQSLSDYLNQLDELEAYVTGRIAEIPEQQRILVTAHDAFQYFGNAYDMRVAGLQGISTVSDFGLKDIANMIDLIIENNISAIFVETSVSDKSIQAIIKGCEEKGHSVEIGGSLYSDALGEFGTVEGTYIGMYRKNIDTIVNALK